jgi:UMF1 family MFS transporter
MQAEIAVPMKRMSRSTLREKWAWYMYDFGNSAYASVVLLAVYAVYFKNVVVGQEAEGTRLWGLSVAIAMLVVAIISPVLGSIADHSGSKKPFLFWFTAMAIAFTALLFLVRRGDVLMGAAFFVLAEIGYRSAQVFYNGLLPEIASPEEIGRVSGNGWAIGAAGGVVCLLLILALIMLIGGDFIVRLSLPITALFFALSVVPLFLWLRERAQPQPLGEGENYLALAFGRLRRTFQEARRYREFLKFMIAFLIFNDGLIMTLNFAAILGTVLFGLDQQGLIIFSVVASVTSVPGAYLFGELADRIGSKPTLLLSLVMMIASLMWLYFTNGSVTLFFIIGGIAGFALSAAQSVSRTMVSQLCPAGQSAEFYGLFAVAGRTSSFIGPAVFGLVAVAATNRFAAQAGALAATPEQMGHRLAILSIVAFLAVGMFLLLIVDVKKGQELANVAEDEKLASV